MEYHYDMDWPKIYGLIGYWTQSHKWGSRLQTLITLGISRLHAGPAYLWREATHEPPERG